MRHHQVRGRSHNPVNDRLGSGESGAGKTVSCVYVMNYIAKVSGGSSGHIQVALSATRLKPLTAPLESQECHPAVQPAA